MDMEARLAAIEAKLQRQEDYREICNIMGRYQYLHTGGQMDLICKELFAYDLPDATSEYGPLGVFGAEKSVEFFDQVVENFTKGTGQCTPGMLEIHQITTPVIEIAEDGKTAKGMWMSTGIIMMKDDPECENGSCTWDTGKYAVDFIKVDGKWKIWHLHVCDMWRADYDENPVTHGGSAQSGVSAEQVEEYKRREAAGEPVRPMGFPVPDGPTTFHYSYALDNFAPREPKFPVPYKTFEETFSY